jgi:hypothetical protein
VQNLSICFTELEREQSTVKDTKQANNLIINSSNSSFIEDLMPVELAYPYENMPFSLVKVIRISIFKKKKNK